MVIDLNQRFIDPGATALDSCALSFAAKASGTVDPNTVGSYVVTYTARDPSGNEAIPVTRSVKVVERRPPGSLTFSLFPTLVQPAPALRLLFRTLDCSRSLPWKVTRGDKLLETFDPVSDYRRSARQRRCDILVPGISVNR
jgi:hypothetical protein